MTEPGSPATQVTAPDVLALLDNEVRDAESNRQRRGWDVWILGAGLAALFWTGISLYETTKLDVVATVRMWLVGVLLAQVIRGVLSVVGQSPSTAAARFIIPSAEPRQKQGFFLAILGQALILATVLWLSPTSPRWATITILSIVAISLLAILVAALVLFLNLPLPAGPQQSSRTVQHVVSWLLVAVVVFGVYGLATPLQFVGPNIPLPEFKLALVAVAIWYLAPLFVSEATPSWFLENLRSLRRDVQLGELTPGQALQRTEALLLGMKGASAADALLAPLMSTLVMIEEEEEEISADINRLSQLSQQAHSLEFISENRDQFLRLRDEFDPIKEEALARLGRNTVRHHELFARYDAVHRRVVWAQFVAPSLVPHALERLLEFAQRLQSHGARLTEFTSIVAAMGPRDSEHVQDDSAKRDAIGHDS